MRLLNRLTTGAAVSALVGVGLFGAVSAYTIPGYQDQLHSHGLDHLNLLHDVQEHLVRAAIIDHPGHKLFQLWSGGLGRILIA